MPHSQMCQVNAACGIAKYSSGYSSRDIFESMIVWRPSQSINHNEYSSQ